MAKERIKKKIQHMWVPDSEKTACGVGICPAPRLRRRMVMSRRVAERSHASA